MALPTVEEVKEAYAANPTFKPSKGNWARFYADGSNRWECCPLSAVAVLRGKLTIGSIWNRVGRAAAVAFALGINCDELSGFVCGVDGAQFEDTSYEPYCRGVEVRKAIFGE